MDFNIDKWLNIYTDNEFERLSDVLIKWASERIKYNV